MSTPLPSFLEMPLMKTLRRPHLVLTRLWVSPQYHTEHYSTTCEVECTKQLFCVLINSYFQSGLKVVEVALLPNTDESMPWPM